MKQEIARLIDILQIPINDIEFDSDGKWVIITSGQVNFSLPILGRINKIIYETKVMPSDWRKLFDNYSQDIENAICKNYPDLKEKAISPAEEINYVTVKGFPKYIRCIFGTVSGTFQL